MKRFRNKADSAIAHSNSNLQSGLGLSIATTVVSASILLAASGCGGGDENAVIVPTAERTERWENYGESTGSTANEYRDRSRGSKAIPGS